MDQIDIQAFTVIVIKGDGIERLLVRTKKGHLEEVNGDIYRYFLLAGKSKIETSRTLN